MPPAPTCGARTTFLLYSTSGDERIARHDLTEFALFQQGRGEQGNRAAACGRQLRLPVFKRARLQRGLSGLVPPIQPHNRASQAAMSDGWTSGLRQAIRSHT